MDHGPSPSPICGGVYWIEVGDSDGVSPNFRHPHVVIQNDELNRSRIHSVVVCAISSNLHRAKEPGNVLLEPGEANLPKASVIVVSQVSAVLKTSLGSYIGQLSAERVTHVYDGLRFLQRTYFDER